MASVQDIQRLDAQFSAMVGRVEKLDFNIDVTKPESLLNTKEELGAIIVDLQELQQAEAVIADGDSSRKHLADEINELLQQTILLYQQLDASIYKALGIDPNNMDGEEDGEDEEDDDDDDDEELMDQHKPLARDEIARLFIFVIRAAKYGQITMNQKSLIKDDIIQCRPYLRQILNQTDSKAVMYALAALAKSLENAQTAGQ
jgi:hypothetical protein